MMAHFFFKTVDQDNRLSQGSLEAASAQVVADHLLQSGQTVLSITELTNQRRSLPAYSLFSRRRVADRTLTDLLTQCRMLVNAGTPLDKALLLIGRSKSRRESVALAGRLQQQIKSGKSFAEALAGLEDDVPAFVVNAIRAGEVSGHLEDVFDRLVAYMERARKVRADIQDALVYPAILCVMAAISVAILMLVLVPQFKPLFDGAGDKIPTLTALILTASDYFPLFLASLFVGSCLAVLGAKAHLRDETKREQWDRSKTRLPFGIGEAVRDSQIAMFARLMALLLQNGVPAPRALALARDAIPNKGFAADVEAARVNIGNGGRLFEGLQSSRFLSNEVLDLLTVGEEASNLPAVLTRIAELSEERLERESKQFMDLLVPALTVALGCLIATIVAAILMALLSINQLALR